MTLKKMFRNLTPDGPKGTKTKTADIASNDTRQANNQDIDLLRRSGLFMVEWYQHTYPEASGAQTDPLLHYIREGADKGCQPNPWFDPNWYRTHAPSSQKYDGPSVCHYLRIGWKKHRNPSKDFSVTLYLDAYPEVKDKGEEPLGHFIRYGRHKGYIAQSSRLGKEKNRQLRADMLTLAASGLFDEDWYRAYYTDVTFHEGSLLEQFLRLGFNSERCPNPYFDTPWYRSAHGDELNGQHPALHYCRTGFMKGYDPSPVFSAKGYFQRHPDLSEGKVNPLSHFITHGLPEGETPPPAPTTMRPDAETKLPVSKNLRLMADFRECPLSSDRDSFNSAAMNIHWVIPDFAKGSGGHMTIFRMISRLQLKGHRQTLWINNPSFHQTPESAAESILKYFQHYTGEIRFVDETFKDAAGDAIIATDCWTVYPVLSAKNFIRRFYFVQDFEPAFHAVGSEHLAAELTYHKDLDCICAGPWLDALVTEKYDRWARHFFLAADQTLYTPPGEARNNKKLRLAVYARHFTARRAVELAFLALETLAGQGKDFVVDFFGAPLPFTSAPFDFVDHGIATPDALASIFRKADIGIVFSATNYSLVPQEMMACGLPIVELKGDNTEAIFPSETVTLAEPSPIEIAAAVAALMEAPDQRQRQADNALKWVSQFSWDKSAVLVENALVERLGAFASDYNSGSGQEDQAIKASVVIPTFNAGPRFRDVLKAVTSQHTPWPFDVLVIDSGSTDETLDILSEFPMVQVHQIKKEDFSHGGTRNLGVEMTSGAYIAFLTHDAMPLNNRWLYALVDLLDRYPTVAGVFGNHLPWPDASVFTKRDLTAHFDRMKTHPLLVSRDTNKDLYDSEDPSWRQVLHFYSDNNSCMRRSVWNDIPYRTIAYGEDQVWADDIIKAGYDKMFAPQATVYHSHDYDAAETFERAKTESAFFKHFFGYTLMESKETLDRVLKGVNESDRLYGEEHHIPDDQMEAQYKLNRAKLEGYLAGASADTAGLFD